MKRSFRVLKSFFIRKHRKKTKRDLIIKMRFQQKHVETLVPCFCFVSAVKLLVEFLDVVLFVPSRFLRDPKRNYQAWNGIKR